MVPQRAISMFFTSSGDDWVGVARWRALARERRRVSRIRRRRAACHRVASHRRVSRRGSVAIRGKRAEMFRRIHFHMQLRRHNDAVFRRQIQLERKRDFRHLARHWVDVSVFKRSLVSKIHVEYHSKHDLLHVRTPWRK